MPAANNTVTTSTAPEEPSPAPILDQQIQGGSASDNLAGGEGDDSVAGGSGDDNLAGMFGDDRLSGGSGNDTLEGGDGDDTLLGGSGDDYLDGNAGDDELTGGTGNDVFAFGNGDTVIDFVLGTDLIDVSFLGVTAENFAEMVSITAVRGGALVTIGTQSMMIANANAAALTSANFGLQNAGNAPIVEAFAAPVVEAPAAPVVEAPAAPVVETPAAPVVETPAAPVAEAPAAPVVETPAAPVVEAPAAPVVEAPAAPVAVAPAPLVAPAPAAPLAQAPAPVAPTAPVAPNNGNNNIENDDVAVIAPGFALTQSDLVGLKALVNGQPYGESVSGVRTLEGDGNNIANPEYGAGGTPFIRLTEARYGDPITTVNADTGEAVIINRAVNPIFDGLDARMVSNVIGAQEANLAPQANNSNLFFSAFSQYLSHGLDFLVKGGSGTIQIGAPGTGRSPGTNNPADLTRGSVVGFDADGNPLHTNNTSNYIDQNQAYGTGTLVGTFLRAGDGQGGSGATLFAGDPDPSNPAFDLLPTLRQLIEEHWTNDTLFVDGDFQTSFQTYYSGLVAEDGTIDAAMVKEMASDFMGSGQPLLLDTNPFISLLDHIIAGDGRVNENITLTSIHTIWARNHNFHVENLKAAGFEGSSEEVYQAAKMINEAEYARVAWTDFTDQLLGGMKGNGSHGWGGYDPTVNVGISHEFAATAFRFGHSLIQQTVRVLNDEGQPIEVTLFDAFLNPSNNPTVFTAPIEQLQAFGYNPQPGYAQIGANAIIGGIVNQPAEEVDANIVDAVRNDLVRISADLFSFNVARGRDLGLGTLNQVRQSLMNSTDPYVAEAIECVREGLSPYTSWDDFQNRNNLSDLVIGQFKQAYPDLVLETQEAIDAFVTTNPDIILVNGNTVKGIDRVDLWVGGLTEAHINKGVVGSTFWVILHEQFDRLQEADRFYYLDRFDNFDFYANNIDGDVEGFVQIVARNTGLTNLPERIFEVAQVPGGLNPVIDALVPVVDIQPPVDTQDPSAEIPTGPVSETPATVVDVPAVPVDETPAPVVDVPAAPVDETPAPVVDVPAAPVDETPAPVVDVPTAPVADTPAPVVDVPTAPVADTPAPVVDVPAAPVDETPAPVVDETPAPPQTTLEDPIKPIEVEIERIGSSRSDVFDGGSLDDTLFGKSGNDTLSGMAGDDELDGGKGSDKLFGGAGQDTLFGGKGMDYLDGGEGADILSGGKGSDTFKFGDDDLVLDFKSGEDVIDLSSMGVTSSNFAEMVTMSRQGSMTTVNVGDESMTLLGSKSIDLDDFMFAEENEAGSLLSEALSIVSGEDNGRIGTDERLQSEDSVSYNAFNVLVDDYSDVVIDLFMPVEPDPIAPMI